MAWRLKRWDGGYVDVADPFLCQQRTAVLSVWEIVVRSHMLKNWTYMCGGARCPLALGHYL